MLILLSRERLRYRLRRALVTGPRRLRLLLSLRKQWRRGRLGWTVLKPYRSLMPVMLLILVMLRQRRRISLGRAGRVNLALILLRLMLLLGPRPLRGLCRHWLEVALTLGLLDCLWLIILPAPSSILIVRSYAIPSGGIASATCQLGAEEAVLEEVIIGVGTSWLLLSLVWMR